MAPVRTLSRKPPPYTKHAIKHTASEHKLRAHANIYGVPVSAEYSYRSAGTAQHSQQEPVMGSSASGRNSVTHSIIKYPSKSSEKELKGASKNMYQTTRFGTVTSLQGQQSATNLFIYNDYVAFQTALAGIEMPYDLREGTTTQPTVDTKAAIMWTKFDYEFMNNTNHQVVMDIYEVTVKHDVASIDAAAFWTFALAQEAMTSQNIVAAANFPLGGVFTPRVQLLTDPGSVPEASEAFRAFWKIEKRTKVILGPGDLHSHKVFHSNPKLLSLEVWDNAPGHNNGHKHYTGQTMVVLRGVPVTDTTSGLTNLCKASVNYMVTIKQQYSGTSKPIKLKRGITEFYTAATADALLVEEPALQNAAPT